MAEINQTVARLNRIKSAVVREWQCMAAAVVDCGGSVDLHGGGVVTKFQLNRHDTP